MGASWKHSLFGVNSQPLIKDYECFLGASSCCYKYKVRSTQLLQVQSKTHPPRKHPSYILQSQIEQKFKPFQLLFQIAPVCECFLGTSFCNIINGFFLTYDYKEQERVILSHFSNMDYFRLSNANKTNLSKDFYSMCFQFNRQIPLGLAIISLHAGTVKTLIANSLTCLNLV